MGFFDKFRDHHSKDEAPAVATVECPHTILTPRWDSVDDMGNDDRAIDFICESCGAHFTTEFARSRRHLI